METMTRHFILNRIKSIKKDEENFRSPFWNRTFVAFHDPIQEKDVNIPLSEVDFDIVPDKELVSFFEMIIRNQEWRMETGAI